jgi:hypothetical protein
MTDEHRFGFDNRIEPRDTPPTPTHFLEEMLRGAYDHGTVLRYHEYDLCHLGENENVWRVEHVGSASPSDDTDDTMIDVVNLGSVQSLFVLESYLSALAEHTPETRAEWREVDRPISRESRPRRTG